jgi:hypothetical protein
MDKVSIGRIVHYVLATGEHRPAIIVRVWPGEYGNDEVKDGINVQVFLDGKNDSDCAGEDAGRVLSSECSAGMAWRTSVRYNGDNLAGSWHWPERE